MVNLPHKVLINTNEHFAHLPSAPIVEAVLDIRAQSAEALDETAARAYLEPRLEGYEFLDSQQEFSHRVTFGVDIPPQQTTMHTWKGVRFQACDEKSTAQFNRDRFVFSRLAPYQNWAAFSNSGLGLWRIFQEMARPEEISRIGLRFINRIELSPGDGFFERYIILRRSLLEILIFRFTGFFTKRPWRCRVIPMPLT